MIRNVALGLFFIALSAGLTAACGDGNGAFGEAGSGASGAGTGTGTPTAQGGSTSDGGSSMGGSTSDGGSSMGGSTSDGGSSMGGSSMGGGGGMGGMGGGTTNPPTCPMAKPMDGDGCDPMGFGGLICDFGDDTCVCDGFPGPTWTCSTCTTAPMDGDPCTTNGEACIAGTSHCECGGFGSNLSWSCFDCPSPPPTDGDACMGNNGAECLYGNTSCDCQGFQNPQWSCATCPAQAPMDGDACTDTGQFCDYPNSNGCVCLNQTWSCF